MPHCIIEHSANLEPTQLIDAVYQGARKSALFQADDIKTRTQIYDYCQSCETPGTFVHVTSKILSGRSIEQRSVLSGLILDELQLLHLPSCSLTVEVLEIERESYAKVITPV